MHHILLAHHSALPAYQAHLFADITDMVQEKTKIYFSDTSVPFKKRAQRAQTCAFSRRARCVAHAKNCIVEADDVLAAGSSCIDFSAAGSRRGPLA
jgi:hypothetical protein